MSRGAYSTSNYFTRADTAITNEPITMACWAYITDNTVANTLINLAHNVTRGEFNLLARTAGSGGKIGAQKRDESANGQTQDSADAYPTNAWFHAAAVFVDDSVRRAYMNGVKGSDASYSVNDPTVDNQTVGCTNYGGTIGGPVAGYIAHVAIWDASLSDANILAISKGLIPRCVQRANLKRYWKVNESTGNLTDLSGNGATLTEIGTVPDPSLNPVIYLGEPPVSNGLVSSKRVGPGALVN